MRAYLAQRFIHAESTQVDPQEEVIEDQLVEGGLQVPQVLTDPLLRQTLARQQEVRDAGRQELLVVLLLRRRIRC